MFRKLTEKATAVAYEAALKKGQLACPSCKAKALPQPSGRADDLITCAKCGTRASGMEWATGGRDGVFEGDADRIPAGTEITRGSDGRGGVTWDIPPSGSYGGFLLFGIFWCAITGAVSLGFLFGEGKNTGNGPDWLIYPFLGLFWTIGLGMLYMAFRNRFARHRVVATRDQVILQREMFGRVTAKSLATAGIVSIQQTLFYEKNNQPVHGIELKGAKGKLKFGSMLTAEEKAWLVADFRRVILPSGTAGAAAGGRHAEAAVRKGAPFSLPLPTGFKNLMIMGVMLSLMGVGFAVFGVLGMKAGSPGRITDAPQVVDPLRQLMNFVTVDFFRSGWILMSALMAVIGGVLWLRALRSRGVAKVLEGDDTQIALRTYQNGRVIQEQAYPRAMVTDVRAITSGNSNGRPMKRIELLVDQRAETIARWIDGAEADEWVRQVRQVI